MNSESSRPWWVAYAVCFVALFLLDRAIGFWNPHVVRLPENFSAGYLEHSVDRLRGTSNLVVFLGDSVLWGYKLDDADVATTRLAAIDEKAHFANLSFEGGSPANSEFALRYLLSRGVHPAAIVINVNLKEFNPLDSSYKRLRPALASVGDSILNATDRRELELLEHDDFNTRANRLVEKYWLLYRYRLDFRQAIFGSEDFSTWLTDAAERITGYSGRYAAVHKPTPDRFLGAYDLSPLDASNVAYKRLEQLADLAREQKIRVVAILTPTNHALLHDYIDNADYDANLTIVQRMLEKRGATVIDLDKAFATSYFLDNDHLNAAGNRTLAELLRQPVAKALH